MRYSASDRARFDAKVDRSAGPDACWPWTAARFSRRGGYGAFGVAGRALAAHRVAFEMATGFSIAPGQDCMHACDNPPCCNPRHLSAGPRSVNAFDAYERRRRRPANRKMTVAQVRVIAATFTGARGEIAAIARAHGVSEAAIRHIVRGRQWRRAVQGVEV